MGALLELTADVTMLHPRSLHWRNSLSRIIYQFNLHFLVPQSHVHGTSQGKEKLKTSQLLMSRSENTSMGKVAKGEDTFSPPTRDFRAPYQMNTRSSTDLCNLLLSVREIESQKGKKMALSLILPQKTLKENKVRISTDHYYCANLTLTEAEVTQFDHKGTEPEVSTEVLTPVKCHPVSLMK